MHGDAGTMQGNEALVANIKSNEAGELHIPFALDLHRRMQGGGSPTSKQGLAPKLEILLTKWYNGGIASPAMPCPPEGEANGWWRSRSV